MYGDGSASEIPREHKSARSKVNKLLRELSDDEDLTDAALTSSSTHPGKPWLRDFNGYLNSTDILGEMTIVKWWGVRMLYNLIFLKTNDSLLAQCISIPGLGVVSS